MAFIAIASVAVLRAPGREPLQEGVAEAVDADPEASTDQASPTDLPSTEAENKLAERESTTPELIAEQTTEAAQQLWPDIEISAGRQIQRALDSGVAQQWKWRGMHGMVVVSDASTTTSGLCKAAYLTLITPEQQDQSEPTVWCRSGDSMQWVRT